MFSALRISVAALVIVVVGGLAMLVVRPLQPDRTYKLTNDILPNYFMVYVHENGSWRQIGAFPDKDQALKYIHQQAERQIDVQYFTVRGDEAN